jgi:hypothetical protein
MKEDKNSKIVALMGTLFMVFGITYFNFDTIKDEDNLRPFIMMLLGLIAIVYFFYLRRNQGK